VKIAQFKEGDLITRIGATDGIGDRSYCGDKLEFVGFDKGIILFIHDFLGEPTLHSVDAAHGWDDDKWDFFPTTLWEKGKQMLYRKAFGKDNG
jgi:hypothetical protein